MSSAEQVRQGCTAESVWRAGLYDSVRLDVFELVRVVCAGGLVRSDPRKQREIYSTTHAGGVLAMAGDMPLLHALGFGNILAVPAHLLTFTLLYFYHIVFLIS